MGISRNLTFIIHCIFNIKSKWEYQRLDVCLLEVTENREWMVTWYWLRQNGGFIVLFYAIVSSWRTYWAIPKFKGSMSHHYLRLTWIFYFNLLPTRCYSTFVMVWRDKIGAKIEQNTVLKKSNFGMQNFFKKQQWSLKKTAVGLLCPS